MGRERPATYPLLRSISVRRDQTHKMLDRRTFLLRGTAAAGLLALLLRVPGVHAEATTAESAEFRAALEALIGKGSPVASGLSLELPESVENGDYVPVALGVDSPMTAESNVKAIHLLSTANPRAAVATFRFTTLSGKAWVTSRMRLAKTQDVVAAAEMSDGTLLMTRRKVDVKVGGCGI
jgi:sulfur-oxidizing protein SoxY